MESPTTPPTDDPNPTNPPSGDGTYTYTPTDYKGLHVGDDIDLSQTYYVNINEGTSNPADWREVTISKDTYYTAVADDGADHNDRVKKTVHEADGKFYGDPAPLKGWTPITGEGMYFMKANEGDTVHNTFLPVQAQNGTLTHDAYSNKLIAARSGNTSDGMITGPSEDIGDWTTGTTATNGNKGVIVVDDAGVEHTVLYANKGSTFHYNMFIYYMDGNDVVFLTQGANESDGDSKYFKNYPSEKKNGVPDNGVGKYYYTYNNTLGSYGGKGYYTGTYYRERSHDGKVALYYVDGGETYWLSTSGVQTEENARTTAKHDHQVVYTGPLYQLQTLQRATYFTYVGGTPVESHLKGDVLTGLTLYTRTMTTGDIPIPVDQGTDETMGTLVDTTNNFSGNLFIQKRLYRAADGTYNIKLESWATGDMSTSGGKPTDIVLVLDQSLSMEKTDMGNGKLRQQALIEAVTQFINELPTTTDSKTNLSNFRVALVGFGNNGDDTTGIFDNGKVTKYSSCGDSTFKAALKSMNNPTEKANALTSASKLDKKGLTYANMGMDLAGKILNSRPDEQKTTRDSVVILFTDGRPGANYAGNDTFADYVIDYAHTMKGSGTKVYTVGLFGSSIEGVESNKLIHEYLKDEELVSQGYAWGGAGSSYPNKYSTYSDTNYAFDNPQERSDAVTDYLNDYYPNWVADGYTFDSDVTLAQSYFFSPHTLDEYMENTSSEYPDAISLDNRGERKGTTDYYFSITPGATAAGEKTPAEQLADVFKNIAQSVAKTDVPVTTDSILKDMINTDDFALPVYDAEHPTDTIQVNTVAAEAINSRKQIQWATTESAATGVTPHPITVTENGTTYLSGVTVSGFDYQKNFSAPNLSDLTKSTKGSKLVVRIKGLMPKHGGEVYSNSEAGIYNPVKENPDHANKDDWTLYLGVESPFDTIAKRSYVVDFNANMKVAESGKLATTEDAKVSNINARAEVSGDNGSFTKSGSTILYQLKEKKIDNQFRDYSYTGSDTALAFGAYYNNTARADGTKTGTVQVTLNKQVFDPDTGKESKVPDLADKAWQVVNMIPASSIYYDDDLKSTTAVIGDGSGYNVKVEVSPNETKSTKGLHSFAFTGTGIDIYCTTDKDGGYAQAKLDGEQVQTMLNYSVTTRYNVPTYSFRGLEYGKHLVQLNILNSSNYRLDGVRIYGPEDDQTIYVSPAPSPDATPAPAQSVDHTEQYAAYINLRQALVNDNTTARVSKSLEDNQMVDNPTDEGADTKPVVGALFVDDSTKLALKRQATGKDEDGNDVLYWEVNEDGSYRLDKDGNKIPRMVTVYKDEFEAYKENSPKQEIYLKAPEDKTPGQAIIFTLSEKAVAAAEHGNLWIGLSAPDQGAGSGEVTLKDQVGETPAKTITVTSGVDMYYPISSDMISNKVVTIKNTGSSMISVTNLKITGDPDIYTAAYADVTPTPTPVVTDDAQAHTNSVDDNAMASTLSVEDVISMVFEPVTMRTIKLAANNGVDPDLAVVEPEPTAEPEPSPTAEPEVTPDPTPVPTHTPNVHTIVKQLISSFVSSLFRSIARLFH